MVANLFIIREIGANTKNEKFRRSFSRIGIRRETESKQEISLQYRARKIRLLIFCGSNPIPPFSLQIAVLFTYKPSCAVLKKMQKNGVTGERLTLSHSMSDFTIKYRHESLDPGGISA